MSESLIDLTSLRPLLEPRSVAVIGASATPGKIGYASVESLRAQGFAGAVYPINPKAGAVCGYPAFADMAAVPGEVDLAVLAIPAKGVAAALESCVEKGVGAAAIISSGFAEVGGEGQVAQERLTEIARRGGMRVLGPNCLGIANLSAGLAVTFSPFFATPMGAGGLGLVSQSGAFGGYVAMMALDRGLSFSAWITTGNEADVDLADGIAYLAGDAATRVILVYMEGARNGPKLIEALKRARAAGKPVIVLKVGRTEVGAEAARSHTAALAGSDAVADALIRQFGAYRARTVAEWFDLGYAYAVGRPPRNRSIGLVTISGGVGIMMADEAVSHGLQVEPLNAEAQAKINDLVPFASPRNPVDVTGHVVFDLSLFEQMVEIMAAAEDFGSLISFSAGSTRTDEAGFRLQGVWERIRQAYPDTYIAVSGACTPKVRKAYEQAGCLVFEAPDQAVRIAAAMAGLQETFAAPVVPAPAPGAAVDLPGGTLDEIEALEVLGAAGMPVVAARRAATPSEAAEIAAETGFPVALKLLSTAITHKSDIGGVALGLEDAAAVEAAFARLLANAARAAPEAGVTECLVAPMVAGGVETILGAHIDPVFGPVVLFGLGGTLVEVVGDTVCRLAPFGVAEAQAMIGETRAARMLHGVRGGPTADVDALAEALSMLSRFAAANAERLVSVDINPFIVRPQGQGAVAVDAVLIAKT